MTAWRWSCAGLLAVFLVLVGIAGEAPAQAEDGTPWAFRPVQRPQPPVAAEGSNPIDAFLGEALQREGITPAPEADRRTLIRRVTFDLTGLPPTPEEVEAFLADTGCDAYERLVDRLLASPRYGERQARHWLDLVRYAETHGYERDDPKPNAWKYRDWAIDAFNRDLPYDRFVVEQLAGDELPDADTSTRTATGMYRLGLIDDEPADPVMDRFDQLDDMIKTIGTTFLGLTIHCARCHDHKFDPIPQTDYYRLLAFLEPAERYRRDVDESIGIDLASDSEVARHKELVAAVDRQAAALRERIGQAKGQAALEAELRRRLEALEKNRPVPPPMVLGLTDAGPTSEPTRLLLRGDAHSPGDEVAPGFLSAIDGSAPQIVPPPNGKTTGRRLALARWIASGSNPLTARVMVNRLWQQHFGRGLAGTPSDFGAMGEEPSHPALLDWLAAEFVARGWSVKAMHRLMVTSAAYRRSGAWNDQAARIDPYNLNLWRRPPRRLEAEAIRDAVLAASGALNLRMGGPSVRPPIAKAVLAGQSVPGKGWAVSRGDDIFRRSIYVYVKRTLPLPELEVLDAPDTAEPCPRRAVTTTAPQALTLLNSAFWHDQAGLFAQRLEQEARGDDRIDRAFQLAFSRRPTDDEKRDSLDFLARQTSLIQARPKPEPDPAREALRAFCLVLLNANEFVTVD
jgi:hypothetical protein